MSTPTHDAEPSSFVASAWGTPTGSILDAKKGTDPKGAAGAAKPQLHMIPSAAMEETAKALHYGAKLKPQPDGSFGYGERNWLQGHPVKGSTYISAAMRHINCVKDGEDMDPEMKCHHFGAAIAGLSIYLDALKHKTLVDDRVLPVKVQPTSVLSADPKAWSLSPPPDGRTYQEDVTWVENMLPHGYRPLLNGEITQDTDEFRDLLGKWVCPPCGGIPIGKGFFPHRTRRPLP